MIQKQLLPILTFVLFTGLMISGCSIGEDERKTHFNQVSANEETKQQDELFEVKSGEFYNDLTTFSDMGEKKMLLANEEFNETKTVNDVDVTLKGYQFTEFTPKEEHRDKFDIFGDNVILFTALFQLDNRGSENIFVYDIGDLFDKNGDEMVGVKPILYRSDLGEEGRLLPGESAQTIEVIAMSKDKYEFFIDKDLRLGFGPLYEYDEMNRISDDEIIFDIDL